MALSQVSLATAARFAPLMVNHALAAKPSWKLAPFCTEVMAGPAALIVRTVLALGSPVTVAVTVPLPGVGPRVTVVEARPWESVRTDAGFTVAPVAVKATSTPGTGSPPASTTCTVNGARKPVPAEPAAVKPATILTAAAVPGSFPPKSNFAMNPSPRGHCALDPPNAGCTAPEDVGRKEEGVR